MRYAPEAFDLTATGRNTLTSPTLLDWRAMRKGSRSIDDFVDQLTSRVKELPRGERAVAYHEVMDAIDPATDQRIQYLAQLLEGRGLEPAAALNLATKATLKSRRAFLFRFLLSDYAKREARNAVTTLLSRPVSPATRADAYKQAIRLLRPPMWASYNQAEARYRLRETHLPAEFVEWAIRERVPTDEVAIHKQVSEWIDEGVHPHEAMYRGMLLAMREYTLDQLMRLGVAQGPDFCVVAAVVSAVVGVVGTVVAIAVPAVQNKKDREAAQRMAREQRNRPLTKDEIDQLARSAVEYSRWSDATAVFFAYTAAYRDGRDRFVESEEGQFKRAWQKLRQDQYELERAEREAELARQREVREQRRGAQRATERTEVGGALARAEAAARARAEAAVAPLVLRRRLKIGGIVLGSLALLGTGVYFGLIRKR